MRVILTNQKDKGRRRISCSPQQETWSQRRRLPVEDELVLSRSFVAREDVQAMCAGMGRRKARREGEGRLELDGIGEDRRRQWRDGELRHGHPGSSFLGLLGAIDRGGRGLFIGTNCA